MSKILPNDWECPKLEDLVSIKYGKGLPTKNLIEKGYPVFGANGIIGCHSEYLYEEEQVLISCRGAYSGKINWSLRQCFVTNNSLVLENVDAHSLDKKYLFYALHTVDKSRLVTGSAQPQVTINNAKELPIPLAPLEQQKRIVAEIEKQFSRLDEAVANLKRVKANLKRYKAAVLKAAVEGKLTEEWRKQHPDVEPADKLLERISNEREDRFQRYLLEWQDAVANWEASGKEGKKPAKPRKSKVLSALGKSELSDLPLLPNGWAWTRLGNLNVDVFDGPFGSNLKSSDYVDDGVRVIRLENIGSLEFVDEKVSFVTEEKFAQLKKHIVGAGDLIFSSFVADGTRVVMLPSHIETAINKADCFCVRTFGETVNGRYLETFLATRTAYEQLVAQVHGATRPRINTTQLKDCPVSLPPEAEQSAIVMEIQARLSVVERIESTIDLEFVRSEQLRQSILKKAFTGRLVPQNFSEQDFL